MASLVESGKYGAINTTDTSTNGFYVIMFTSGAYTLQENKTIDRQIITAGELVAKSQYLCSTQIDTNWYWNQQTKHHAITVPTRTILQRNSKMANTFNNDEIIPLFVFIIFAVCSIMVKKETTELYLLLMLASICHYYDNLIFLQKVYTG